MNKKLDVTGSVTPVKAEVPHLTKTQKERTKEKIEELIKEESRMVRGIFQCFESPGGTVKITVKKYPGSPPFEKTMSDGNEYEIPLYVARHLNGVDVSAGALGDAATRNQNIGTCSYPVHGFAWKQGQSMPGSQVDAMGVPVPMIGIAKRVKRYGFQSLEFGANVA